MPVMGGDSEEIRGCVDEVGDSDGARGSGNYCGQ